MRGWLLSRDLSMWMPPASQLGFNSRRGCGEMKQQGVQPPKNLGLEEETLASPSNPISQVLW